ncbi:MAG: four helix bundle protein [Flavobacteriales bacterium]|jgi:four helix bundle protein
MFVFENLEVYKKAVLLYTKISALKLGITYHDKTIANQLMRSTLSIPLNIAEGSGKESNKDRKNYLLISRGSLYETVSILNILKVNGTIKIEVYAELYQIAEEVSKMLRVMINNLIQEIAYPRKT